MGVALITVGTMLCTLGEVNLDALGVGLNVASTVPEDRGGRRATFRHG